MSDDKLTVIYLAENFGRSYPVSKSGGLRFIVDTGGDCQEFDAFTLEIARKFEAKEITLSEAEEIAVKSWSAFKAKIEAQERQRVIERQAYVVKQWETENIPAEFVRTVDPARLANPAAFNRVVNWQRNPRGLLLHGPTGAGKTRAAFALIRRLAEEAQRDCGTPNLFLRRSGLYDNFPVIVRAADFSVEIVKLAMNHGSECGDTLESYLRELTQCRVLFIDDIDKCRFSPRVVCELLNVIDARTANGKPLIVTTQLSDANRLANMIAGGTADSKEHATSIVRRLQDYCEAMDFRKVPEK